MDAVFSNATFHWIRDHDRLFATLFAASAARGRVEAQCGGQGNVDELVNAADGDRGRRALLPLPADDGADLELRRASGDTRPTWSAPASRSSELWLDEPRRHAARPAHLHRRLGPRTRTSSACPSELRRSSWTRCSARCRGRSRCSYVRPQHRCRAGGSACMSAATRPPSRRRDRPRDRRRGASRCSTRSATSRSPSSWSAAPRSTRTGRRSPTRCWRPAAPPTPCCSARSAARSGTRPTPTRRAPSRACSGLRKGLGLYANLRPVKPSPSLLAASPLRPERIEGTDLLVVRELTGGIYFGDSGRDGDVAHDTCEYSVAEIERIARVGVRGARARGAGGTRHLGRQGQRARDLAPVARDRRARGGRATTTSSSTTCSSTTPRCSSSPTRRAST